MLQIISTILFYLWMFLTLFLLWKIWRNSITTAQAWQTLVAVSVKAADAAHESARLAAILAAKGSPPTLVEETPPA